VPAYSHLFGGSLYQCLCHHLAQKPLCRHPVEDSHALTDKQFPDATPNNNLSHASNISNHHTTRNNRPSSLPDSTRCSPSLQPSFAKRRDKRRHVCDSCRLLLVKRNGARPPCTACEIREVQCSFAYAEAQEGVNNHSRLERMRKSSLWGHTFPM
jgi:hypothetical protein